MLWLGPNRKLTQILSAANDVSRRRTTRGPKTEQCLKRGHGGFPPVMAEDEFIEVDLQLVAPDAVVGPDEPLLQVADRSMDGWQYRRSARPDLLHRRHVTVAGRPKAFERLEPVGVDGRPGSDMAFGKRREGVLAEVRNHLHADTPGSSASLLYRDRDQNRFASFELATAPQPWLRAAHPCVVEFDVAVQRLARGAHHRASELVQQQPSGLVPSESQLALEQQRRDPSLVGRHQIGCPKPDRQRELGPMQDRACGQGNLITTLGTLATLPIAEGERSPVSAAWTPKPLRPSTGLKVLSAGLLIREPSLKLGEACRERRTRHRGTLLMAAS